MKFIFSIFFISGLFLTPSLAQGPCLVVVPGEGIPTCFKRTKTCRAPKAGEDRAVRCRCGMLLGLLTGSPSNKLSQEDQLIVDGFTEKIKKGEVRSPDFSKIEGFAVSNESLAIGVAKSDKRAREDALNTCDSIISGTLMPLLIKGIKEAGASSVEAEALARISVREKNLEFRKTLACSEAYVCDKGRSIEPPNFFLPPSGNGNLSPSQ